MNESERPRSAAVSGGARGRLSAWPIAFIRYFIEKWKGWSASKQMLEQAASFDLDVGAIAELTAAWKKAETPANGPAVPGVQSMSGSMPHQHAVLAEAAAPLGLVEPEHAAGTAPAWSSTLGDGERAIIHRIREETRRLNRNNVTRTEAYRAVYGRNPELHWAMLAHMVSRNGGWNMTDLQGELIPRLLGPEQREPTFRLLERANALIFQDAYPQLLLYETGRRIGRDLSSLLPMFGVSRFMQPVWTQFHRRGDPVPLTIALIVNEQHYIERRVVRHPYYRKHVLGTLFFGMQSLLQLNQVVFPYRVPMPEGREARPESQPFRLAGLVMENFDNLRERIEFGKRLYALMFGIPDVREGVHRFARLVRHSGSRADYAPQLFASIRHRPPQRPYRERINGVQLRPGSEPLYSPRLTDAWADMPVAPAESGDWFESADDIVPYFRELPLPSSFEMTHEYGFGLSKVELAVQTAEELGAGRSE